MKPAVPNWVFEQFARPWAHGLTGFAILLLDLLTGPFLLFPILFVVPVALCAWFYNARFAYALAVLLPAGRLLIAEFVDRPYPLLYITANALVRIGVLLLLAFLVARTARQTKLLQERIAGFATICAWSRTVEYQGEWISFEEYLKRRFNIDTSHGISPAEAEKLLGDQQPSDTAENNAAVFKRGNPGAPPRGKARASQHQPLRSNTPACRSGTP